MPPQSSPTTTTTMIVPTEVFETLKKTQENDAFFVDGGGIKSRTREVHRPSSPTRPASPKRLGRRNLLAKIPSFRGSDKSKDKDSKHSRKKDKPSSHKSSSSSSSSSMRKLERSNSAMHLEKTVGDLYQTGGYGDDDDNDNNKKMKDKRSKMLREESQRTLQKSRAARKKAMKGLEANSQLSSRSLLLARSDSNRSIQSGSSRDLANSDLHDVAVIAGASTATTTTAAGRGGLTRSNSSRSMTRSKSESTSSTHQRRRQKSSNGLEGRGLKRAESFRTSKQAAAAASTATVQRGLTRATSFKTSSTTTTTTSEKESSGRGGGLERSQSFRTKAGRRSRQVSSTGKTPPLTRENKLSSSNRPGSVSRRSSSRSRRSESRTTPGRSSSSSSEHNRSSEHSRSESRRRRRQVSSSGRKSNDGDAGEAELKKSPKAEEGETGGSRKRSESSRHRRHKSPSVRARSSKTEMVPEEEEPAASPGSNSRPEGGLTEFERMFAVQAGSS